MMYLVENSLDYDVPASIEASRRTPVDHIWKMNWFR